MSLAEKLIGVAVKKIGGDQGYSGNDNRTFCRDKNNRDLVQGAAEDKRQENPPEYYHNVCGYSDGLCGMRFLTIDSPQHSFAKQMQGEPIEFLSLFLIFNDCKFYIYSKNHMGFADLFKKDYAELALNEARNGNYMKAAEHFKTAFNKTNNSEYIINAARMYEACNENGLLLECLRIGSSKGDEKCLIWLGNIYRDGKIVKANRILAENYYRLATEVGSSFAYYMWGQMYYIFIKNHPTQFQTAMDLFEKGFVRGSSDCANIIGEMYYYGFGVEVDIQKALEYYRLSIQDHNATGYYNLGRHYYFGVGVKRDDNVAYNYFIEAEKRGCYYAAEFLSKDRTKLRSHLEMKAKYFGKYIGNEAVDIITNTLTEGIADGIAKGII